MIDRTARTRLALVSLEGWGSLSPYARESLRVPIEWRPRDAPVAAPGGNCPVTDPDFSPVRLTWRAWDGVGDGHGRFLPDGGRSAYFVAAWMVEGSAALAEVERKVRAIGEGAMRMRVAATDGPFRLTREGFVFRCRDETEVPRETLFERSAPVVGLSTAGDWETIEQGICAPWPVGAAPELGAAVAPAAADYAPVRPEPCRWVVMVRPEGETGWRRAVALATPAAARDAALDRARADGFTSTVRVVDVGTRLPWMLVRRATKAGGVRVLTRVESAADADGFALEELQAGA